jgi:hypothetical protein
MCWSRRLEWLKRTWSDNVPASLRELQDRLSAAILEQHVVPEEISDGAFSAAERVQIYRRNTVVTLTEALAACYPTVQSLVGEEFFSQVAEQYIGLYPPTSGNLHDFGSALATFLAHFTPAQALAYLPDVTRLEWARQLSYHADDAPALEIETLKAVSPTELEGLCFVQHPATQLIASPYPIFDIWQLHQSNDPQTMVDLGVGGQHVRVFRHRLKVDIELLGSAEYLWLQSLADGRAFGEATDVALAADGEFELLLHLQRHLVGGTWTAVTSSHHTQMVILPKEPA